MPELDIPYWLERCSVEDTGSVLDLQGPHPWRWIKWIFVAIYVLLLDPSLVDRSLAWMWIGSQDSSP